MIRTKCPNCGKKISEYDGKYIECGCTPEEVLNSINK